MKQEGKWESAQKKIAEYFTERGVSQPVYEHGLPAGNDGFGLGLLGMTGDALLDAETYQNIKLKR